MKEERSNNCFEEKSRSNYFSLLHNLPFNLTFFSVSCIIKKISCSVQYNLANAIAIFLRLQYVLNGDLKFLIYRTEYKRLEEEDHCLKIAEA